MKINAKSIFLFTLGLTYSALGFSQTNAPQGLDAQMNLNRLASGATSNVRVFDNRYEGVKGSPYFLESWAPGEIEIKANNTGKTEVIKDLKLKYDVFSNLLVAVIPQSKDTLQIGTQPVISFRLDVPTGDNKLEFRRIKEARELDPALSDAFFAVLYDSQNGKATVLKRIAKKKIEANFKGPYSAGQNYDEIVDETSYYVVANGKMKKVKLNRKSLLEAFPEKADQIKSFISSQKLAMSSEADLIKAVTYYQSL
ncbi:hypothetical protein [Rufibacter hautae]|uniref:Uncharacterized protein n=1 Tax=Rufibacter hautae TaxID=2595005 RepID=A0A5B6TD97_9BACT|nr:hypothetical protein [Rufibacter hautae]KAA3438136.1 hypothetical protein FOA19_12795 [Rufibacter hautae]